MKKSIKILLMIIAIILIVSKNDTYAAGGLCTTEKYNALKAKVREITVGWKLNFDEEHHAYFTIELQNVDDDLILIMNDYNYVPKDGIIKINEYLLGGEVYEFKIYGGYNTDCVEEYLNTKKVKVPKYNIYSEMKECEENKEWEVCDKWYQGEIKNEDDFYAKLAEYKNKDKPKEEIEKTNKKDFTPYIIIIVVLLVIIGYMYCKSSKKLYRKKVNHEKK